jgi:hypothetical protein
VLTINNILSNIIDYKPYDVNNILQYN